jgi:hypothetical protein
MIRIIGKMSAEFNTMMKHYSKLAAQNYEKSSPSDEHWGGRNHRSSTDAAMIKLLGYESARMNKDTMIIVNYDATADFDRMYHEYGNMLDAKKKVDRVICECMSGTIERAMRNVETGLRMSKITYKKRNGEKKMTGEIQGKANVPQRSNLQKDQMIQAHNELSAGV